MDDCFCDIDPTDQETWDIHEATAMRQHAIVSARNETWRTLLAKFDPPIDPHDIDIYREWLVEHSPDSSNWSYDMFPIKRGQTIQEGLVFLPPTGSNWAVLLEDKRLKENQTSSAELKRLLNSAMAQSIRWMRSLYMEPTYSQQANVKTRVKTMQEGLIALPTNLKQAFERNESIVV